MKINAQSPTSLIKAWQSFLNQQGYNTGTPDGIWGAHTRSATEQFQSAAQLTADGLVGPATIAAAETKGFTPPTSPSTSAHFPPTGNIDTVFDISHHNANVDLAQAKAAGMNAVFHKATQSYGSHLFHDKMYPIRRKAAKAAGLLWGAFHFGTSGDPQAQAEAFLAYVQAQQDTLLVLDFERCTTTGETTMSLAEAVTFVEYIKNKTGKYPGLYGGRLLRESLAGVNESPLSQCWLWIAQYASHPQVPGLWSQYTLWQYTDGSLGPVHEPVAGVGVCDRDVFMGTEEQLQQFWTAHQV